MLGGGLGFLVAGVSSYLGSKLLPFVEPKTIIFFPQGAAMCFYGVLGLFFSFYLGLTAWWDIGGGFNEFNRGEGFVHVFRWGFPGRGRRIDLFYPIESVREIRVELKEGVSPRRTIYMRVASQREIPLSETGAPMAVEEIEAQAYELAKFLQVPLELSP